MFPRVLLWLHALGFIVFGAIFVIDPVNAFKWLSDSGVTTDSAAVELRATYAGMSLAVGVFGVWLAIQSDGVRRGLVLFLFVYAGLGLSRLYGMASVADANQNMTIAFVAEVVLALLTVVAIKKAD